MGLSIGSRKLWPWSFLDFTRLFSKEPLISMLFSLIAGKSHVVLSYSSVLPS